MKNIKILFILSILIFSGCAENQNNQDLKNDLVQLKTDNAMLKKNIDSLNKEFILPFKLYQENVMSELKSHPDSIINSYKNIIAKYPKSYWSHEAKRRIENIKTKRIFWSKEKGWDLNIPKKPDFDESKISCPGC